MKVVGASGVHLFMPGAGMVNTQKLMLYMCDDTSSFFITLFLGIRDKTWTILEKTDLDTLISKN